MYNLDVSSINKTYCANYAFTETRYEVTGFST